MNYMNGSLCAKILSEIIAMKEFRTVPFFILTAYENNASNLINGVLQVYTKPMSKKIIMDILNKIENKFN